MTNYKGDKAGKTAMHHYIAKHYGRPSICENPLCEGKSKSFDWCIKTGRAYSHNREDYLRMCRSCHRRYDLTPEKKLKAVAGCRICLTISLYPSQPCCKNESFTIDAFTSDPKVFLAGSRFKVFSNDSQYSFHSDFIARMSGETSSCRLK